MRCSARTCLILLLAAVCSTVPAGVLLEPTPAPEWKVSDWINGDGGKLGDYRGQVVLIDFFQLWCPGCQEFSVPLFNRWTEEFGSRDDVVVISIHTVFEGHNQQSSSRLRRFVTEMGITHPVGIDSYKNQGDDVPITMDRYETGGTPHVAIVDHNGMLRFSHFGRFDPAPVERYITRLLEDHEKKLRNTKSTPRRTGNKSRQRPTPPPPPQAQPKPQEQEEDSDSEDQKPKDEIDRELSGSFKLRFEPLSRSCGDIGQPVEVITQVSVYQTKIVAKFSRAYLGIRSLTATYDATSGDIEAAVDQPAKERGNIAVELSLQLNGRLLIIENEPELDFDYYLDKRNEDGSFDCTIEGRGGGKRFRSR